MLKHSTRRWLVLAAAFVVVGCSGATPQPAPEIVAPEIAPSTTVRAGALPFQLRDGFWVNDVPLRCLGADVTLSVMEESREGPTKSQLEAIHSIEKLDASFASQLDAALRRDVKRVEESIDLREEGVNLERDRLRKHVRLKTVIVPVLRDFPGACVLIHGECDWRPEDGLQIVVLNGELVGCGPQNTLIWGAKWTRMLKACPEDWKALLAE